MMYNNVLNVYVIHVASVCQADRPTLLAGQAEQEIPPDNIGCSSPKQ